MNPTPLVGAGHGDAMCLVPELEQQAAAPIPGVGHRAAIQAMAEELQLSVDEVAQAYCDELARIWGSATVVDYLPVLVAKKVRALYKRKSTFPPDSD